HPSSSLAASALSIYGFLRTKIRWEHGTFCRAHFGWLFLINPLAASPPLGEQAPEKAILKAVAILSSKGVDSRQRSRVFADYRRAVLPFLTNKSFGPAGQSEFFDPDEFADHPC
ncbi:MAG: hypothetical protein WBL39_12935, partial [Terrimicrobiaceae bacterium]